MINKGMFFTPDKKKLLTDEIQSEINKVDQAIKLKLGVGGKATEALQESKKKLQSLLDLLFDKKGVITPQETDDILTAIDESKRNRLESQFYFGLKKTTFYMILLVGAGVGAYLYYKKKAQ